MESTKKHLAYLFLYLGLDFPGVEEEQEEEDEQDAKFRLLVEKADSYAEGLTAGRALALERPAFGCQACEYEICQPCPACAPKAGAPALHHKGRFQSVTSYLRARRKHYESLRLRSKSHR